MVGPRWFFYNSIIRVKHDAISPITICLKCLTILEESTIDLGWGLLTVLCFNIVLFEPGDTSAAMQDDATQWCM